MGLFGSFNKPAAAPVAPAQPTAPAGAPAAAPAARPAFAGAPGPGRNTPAAPPANLFAGVPAAEVLSRNPWITPGRYVVVIDNIVTKQNRKGLWRVIAEGKILETVSKEATSLADGSTFAQAYSFEHDSFSRAVKGMICGLLRLDPNDPNVLITQEDVTMACGSALDEKGQPVLSPLIGMVGVLNARHAPTKAGGVFTQTDWSPGPRFAEIARLTAANPAARANFWKPGVFEKLLALETAT